MEKAFDKVCKKEQKKLNFYQIRWDELKKGIQSTHVTLIKKILPCLKQQVTSTPTKRIPSFRTQITTR